jgi:hypothetical protein
MLSSGNQILLFKIVISLSNNPSLRTITMMNMAETGSGSNAHSQKSQRKIEISINLLKK